MRIPVYDASTSVLEFQKSAEKIIKFIAVGLVHGNVLVHCQMGASRSVTAAIMYLIQ
jgi:protein-tyrosine phosphatase